MLKIKVENMESPSSGNLVANQFTIWTNKYVYFQSYKTIIACIDRKTDKVVLDRNSWDYSTTTGKYRNNFLGEGIAETRKKIKSGEYKLTNLNEENGN